MLTESSLMLISTKEAFSLLLLIIILFLILTWQIGKRARNVKYRK